MSYQAWIVTVEEIQDLVQDRNESLIDVLKYLLATYNDKPVLLENNGRLTPLIKHDLVLA